MCQAMCSEHGTTSQGAPALPHCHPHDRDACHWGPSGALDRHAPSLDVTWEKAGICPGNACAVGSGPMEGCRADIRLPDPEARGSPSPESTAQGPEQKLTAPRGQRAEPVQNQPPSPQGPRTKPPRL